MSKRIFIAWVTLVSVLFFTRAAFAAPAAHILRIDPRAGMSDGQPVLTTVVEVVQFTSLSEVVTAAGCGQQKGDPLLDCISNAVEAKNKLWQAFPFPEQGANLLVRVDNQENPAKFVSKSAWGATRDPLVGTAYLIALDASSLMGPRYGDAREVANQFIGSLGPNDIAKLIIFDDRISPYVATSPWVPGAQKATLVSVLQANPAPSPSHSRGRPLFNQIKNITKAFGEIGNAGQIQNVPMHQAMVVLSNGAGREDAGSAAISAEAMKQYFNKGRFPEDNPLAPKTPLPVISVFFPSAHGMANDLYAGNDLQFMQDLSNPEIGGFFDIVRTGQGVTKAGIILQNVKARFNQMWVVKWKMACLAPTAEQTFNLVFRGTTPAILPDGSFKDVPIGVDPTQWPLDLNIAQTKAEADANPVHPGGTFRVYGDFCWGGDKNRAEAYFVPAGTQPDPNVNRQSVDAAKKAMQQLIAQNMRGGAIEASDTFVTFTVPDEEKLLEGQGDNTVTRVVIYDNKAKRASGYEAKNVLTLKAGKKPLNLPIILGAAGLVVVILLLVIVLLRGGGGGGKKGRGGAPPPAPVVAGGYGGPQGPGYGPPGGGYGGGPPGGGYGGPPGGGYGGGGGGYGAAPVNQPPAPLQAGTEKVPDYVQNAPVAMAAIPPPPATRQSGGTAQVGAPPPFVGSSPPPALGSPPPRGGADPLALAGGAPQEVRCPACNARTPGQSAVCFSCGQPLPHNLPAAGASAAGVPAPAGQQQPPSFPLTGAMESRLEPPPNPYGSDTTFTAATIIGAAGQWAIRGGVDVRVGRDPAQCPITLTEPRVSGLHATLKFDAGQLFVRDEGSNNGTHVAGARIPQGMWTSVPNGSTLKFGPIEFTVRFE